MSAPPKQFAQTSDNVLAIELAKMKENHVAVKADLDSLDSRFGALETEMRHGFRAITESMQRIAAPKGAPWQMISIVVGLGLALGSWANTYFGQGINAAAKAAELANDRQDKLATKLESVNQQLWTHAVDAARKEGFTNATQDFTSKEAQRIREELDILAKGGKVGP